LMNNKQRPILEMPEGEKSSNSTMFFHWFMSII
jgi:hypothetical protein